MLPARKPTSAYGEKAAVDALVARGEAILDKADEEDRGLTAAENQQMDAIMVDLDRHKMARKMKDASTGRPADNGLLFPDDNPTAGRISAVSGGTVKAFSNDRAGKEAAYRSGRFLAATLLGDEKSRAWCQSNGMDIDRSIRMVHSGSENSKGGVLVPEEMSGTIIRLVVEYGLFRRLARVAPMGSDTLNIPRRTGGLTAHYTGENTEGTESDTSWDNVALVAKKLMVLTRMSSEISEDSIISMADTLAMETALAFALKEDTVGFTGTGISTDGGIVGVNVKALDGSHGLASVAAASGHDTLPEIDADDLINLMAAVPSYAKRGSAFVCSPSALEVVFNAIKIAGGGNSLDNLANMVQPRFLGYPVEVTDVYPDDVTANLNGAVMIGFGNLQQATTLGTRREIRMALSTDRYFELDQIGVKGTLRHDINVHDLGSDTVKSPFCVLTGTT